MESRWQTLGHHVGLLVLRLGIGGFMAAHGWGKFLKVVNGEFDPNFDPIGLGSTLSLVLIMLAEFGGSLCVIAGFCTRAAAATVVFGMGVAAFVAHASAPWLMGPGPSKEPALLFGIAFLAILFTGPGVLSVDHLIWPPIRRWWAARKAQSQPEA